MRIRFPLLLLLAAGLSAQAPLTNRDIVTLAKAGFDEQFLSGLITRSPTKFDLSVDALAALAREGVSPGTVKAMLQPASPAAKPKAPVPKAPTKLPPLEMSIERGAPFYESKSFLWGFSKTTVITGAGNSGSAAPDAVTTHLGSLYSGKPR
jgi:hypothetical protein